MYATTDDGIDTGTATGCDKKSFRTVKEIHQQMVLLSFYLEVLSFLSIFVVTHISDHYELQQ